mgnify:CR=1 FL=1
MRCPLVVGLTAGEAHPPNKAVTMLVGAPRVTPSFRYGKYPRGQRGHVMKLPLGNHRDRLKEKWEAEYREWSRRDLSDEHYVYIWADGVHFNVRLEEDRTCILVLMGATAEGDKHLLAVQDGYRDPGKRAVVEVAALGRQAARADRRSEAGQGRRGLSGGKLLEGAAAGVPRDPAPAVLGELVRGHWGVENQLHWRFDVSFADDQSRVRKDHGPESLALIKRLTLGLLKQIDPPARTLAAARRTSIPRRHIAAMFDEDYLLRCLTAAMPS